ERAGGGAGEDPGNHESDDELFWAHGAPLFARAVTEAPARDRPIDNARASRKFRQSMPEVTGIQRHARDDLTTISYISTRCRTALPGAAPRDSVRGMRRIRGGLTSLSLSLSVLTVLDVVWERAGHAQEAPPGEPEVQLQGESVAPAPPPPPPQS